MGVMAKGQGGGTLRQVHLLFNVGTIGGLTDGQLLEQFRSQGGEAGKLAFAALVERHGPVVLRTCQSILPDEHAVEDAFQATFLILVRRAGSLWVRDSLGPWLHQVAYRVASCARSAAARRRRHERKTAEMADPAVSDPAGDDLGSVLHEELDRLPVRYRAPIVLCCLEGLTHQQAAGHLGWPLGTLQSRLARGRERLRGRLIRRGLAPSAGLSGVVLSGEAAWAVVPTVLVDSTIRAAMAYAAGKATTATVVSSSVAALTKGILKMMFLHKLKMIAGALLTVGVIATGVGGWAQQESRGTRRTAGGAQRSESRPQARRTTPKAVESSAADEGMLKYGDERADGKQSFGGSGEMIEFSSPSESAKVAGLRIHGSRYGLPQPPEENFLIYFLSHDLKRILHTEMAPYSLFERGPERWIEVTFERTIDLPKTFWVALDFRANQRKGVYVSFDASTGGKHSRVGLPGIPAAEPRFGGDWMIEAILAKRKTVPGSP
jgi:RNA polymerase sigma factor (sigma-70 family)